MRDRFISELLQRAKSDQKILLITGDLGFGVFDKYREELPDQFINAGVSEQNMTALACGLALEGFKVFTYSIGNFPTLRCLEQIRNDVCYHDANVTVVSIGGGFSYGQLGVSHFATEDLSIMRAIPNLTILAPSGEQQVAEMVQGIDEIQGPKYIRLDKDSAPHIPSRTPFELGRVERLVEGSDGTLICIGGILKEGLKAAEILELQGIKLRVLSVESLKPLSTGEILLAAQQTPLVCTLEENTKLGGLAGAVSEIFLAEGEYPETFHPFGIPDKYPEIVGDQSFLRRHFHLDAESVSSTITRLIEK